MSLSTKEAPDALVTRVQAIAAKARATDPRKAVPQELHDWLRPYSDVFRKDGPWMSVKFWWPGGEYRG